VSTVVTSYSSTKPGTFGYLKKKVARIVGGERQPTILAACGEFLNEQIVKFNAALYECNKVETAIITVTNGADTSLPTLFYKEIEFRVTDVHGDKINELTYIDYAEYHKVFVTRPASLGTFTCYYTLFNVHADGKIRLLPQPDYGASASTQYIKGSYYKRFALLAEDGDILDAPQEIENALVYGAQVEALTIYAPNSPALPVKAMDARDALSRFEKSDRQHEDQHRRFRLPPPTFAGYYSWPYYPGY
jgi:hypothetical protein